MTATLKPKAAAIEWLRTVALDEQSPARPHAELLLRELCSALGEVGAERTRQITVEGWTHDHDDFHDAGELAAAGGSYALHAAKELYPGEGPFGFAESPPPCWLWDDKWWKPKDPRRDLVRAAALIVAEIERLDRQTKPKESA